MSRSTKIAGLALAVVVGGGCVTGVKHPYHTILADLAASGSGIVAVATHDQRTYVLNGNKSPAFVGLSRGSWGEPFDVSTASENPLAEDLTWSMSASLENRGFRVDDVNIDHSAAPDAVIASLKATGAHRLVLLTLAKWKSDTFYNTALIYDATLEIFSSDGSPLATSHVAGRDNLGGNALLGPPTHARQAVPSAAGEKLEELFNDPRIMGALQ